MLRALSTNGQLSRVDTPLEILYPAVVCQSLELSLIIYSLRLDREQAAWSLPL
jgi:hypothetical protein